MSTKPQGIFIFGAGGHGKVVADIVERQGVYRLAAVFDDDPSRHGQPFFGYTVCGGRDALLRLYDEGLIVAGIVAIGDNEKRADMAAWLTEHGIARIVAIHPSAQIGRGVVIGEGSVLMAGCVVNSDTVIGMDAIINTGATVDHDCTIGHAVHIAPGCHLCGCVKVGEGSLIGAGSTVIPGVVIGANVLVGAGSTVLRDIPAGARVAGSPCRNLVN